MEQQSGRTGCSLSPVSIERDKAYLSYTRGRLARDAG